MLMVRDDTDRAEDESTVARLQREGLVPLRVAAQAVFKESIHPRVLRRWHSRGSKSQHGPVVRLEMILVGKLWHTSHAAVQRYLIALNQ